jgi:CxxC motif-containing protein (DUF1111 family)
MVPRFLIAASALAASILAASPALAHDSLDSVAGHALFDRNWVASPSAVRTASGLGPLYNARACSACHSSSPLAPDAGLVVRLGHSDGTPDPVYGAQLQTRALPGLEPEGAPHLQWHVDRGLRTVALTIDTLSDDGLDRRTRIGLRRAPDLSGAGLIAAIPEVEILTAARRQSSTVHGRPDWLCDAHRHCRLGRFGLKAEFADLLDAISQALSRDIGISTSSRPAAWGDCTAIETACRRRATQTQPAGPEASDAVVSAIAAYVGSLPAGRRFDLRSGGAATFRAAGCAACHTVMKTTSGAAIPLFSDLLLHDMGRGLDDGIAEAGAKSSEWRTAPLWNLKTDLARGGLLHDGRARSIGEAVAWHGGDAAFARSRYAGLGSDARLSIKHFLMGD